MGRHELSIVCPFCHGNKRVKVDISEAIDREVQKALIKVYEQLKKSEAQDGEENG